MFSRGCHVADKGCIKNLTNNKLFGTYQKKALSETQQSIWLCALVETYFASSDWNERAGAEGGIPNCLTPLTESGLKIQ